MDELIVVQRTSHSPGIIASSCLSLPIFLPRPVCACRRDQTIGNTADKLTLSFAYILPGEVKEIKKYRGYSSTRETRAIHERSPVAFKPFLHQECVGAGLNRDRPIC